MTVGIVMKPFIVLLGTFAISIGTINFFYSSYEIALSGRIAMSVMLVFTATAHFVFTKGMAMMVPDFIPYKTATIYATGVIEIAAAVGLFIPSLQIVTAWLLIIFFICILPANIYAAMKNIDYQKGTTDGNGLKYLWFRIPLQVLFIVWTYLSAIQY